MAGSGLVVQIFIIYLLIKRAQAPEVEWACCAGRQVDAGMGQTKRLHRADVGLR